MKPIAFLLLAGALAPAQQSRPKGLYAIIQTSEGDIVARLFEKDTPKTVRQFVALAQGKMAWRDPVTHAAVTRPLYDNTTFFRVTPGVMIQAGSPNGLTTFNCGVTVADEFLPGLRFDIAGKLAMANTGQPDSGGCQFFITADVQPSWSGKYTIFGEVVEGREVVHKIAHAKVVGEKPVEPVKIVHVVIERSGPEPKSKH